MATISVLGLCSTPSPVGLLWKWQITPQVVEETVAISAGGVKTFAAEHPELAVVIDPVAGTPTRTGIVRYVRPNNRVGLQAVDSILTDRVGTLDPSPLAVLEDPKVGEGTVAGRVETLSAKKLQTRVTKNVLVGPRGHAPTRTGGVPSGRRALSSIRAGLIYDIRPAGPCPLACTKFPQIIEGVGLAGRREVVAAKDPEIA